MAEGGTDLRRSQGLSLKRSEGRAFKPAVAPSHVLDSHLYSAAAAKTDDPESQEKDSGQARLEALGYQQLLSRRFGLLSSAASSFAVTSYMMSLTGSLPGAYVTGGSVPALWGWLIVAIFNFAVVLSMAELSSAYPMAGGPYFWCVELTNNELQYALIAWCTAWLNILGQLAATAGAGYLTAEHIGVMIDLVHDYDLEQYERFLIYSICLIIAGLLCAVSTEGTRIFTLFAAGYLVVAGLFLMIILPLLAPTHQSTAWVFITFNTTAAEDRGLSNTGYIFVLGMLLNQFSYIGGEAPAQFAEETKRADIIVPWGLVLGCALTGVMGFGYLLVLFYCIQDPDGMMSGDADGYIVAQIFYDVFQARYGSGTGAVWLLLVPLVAIFNTVVMCMATNARMLWSFSRDGGVPLHRVWGAINGVTGAPVNAAWAMTALAFLLGLPMLWSHTAFVAIGSMSALGLFISYTVPIVLRLVMAKNFKPGPFTLGRARIAINTVAVLWMVLISVLCIIPAALPVTVENMNWAVVIVGILLALCLLTWYFPLCGTRWYKGGAHTKRVDALALPEGAAEERGAHSSFAAKALHRSNSASEKLTLLHLLAGTVPLKEVSMSGRWVVPVPHGSGSQPSSPGGVRLPHWARGGKSPSGSGSALNPLNPPEAGKPSAYSVCTSGPLKGDGCAVVKRAPGPGLPRPRSGLLASIQDEGEPSKP